jgi:hypothetical protein
MKLRHYQGWWSKRINKGNIMVDYHGPKWTTWFLWNSGVTKSDIHSRLSAVGGDGRLRAAVARHGTARHTAQAAICEQCCNTS